MTVLVSLQLILHCICNNIFFIYSLSLHTFCRVLYVQFFFGCSLFSIKSNWNCLTILQGILPSLFPLSNQNIPSYWWVRHTHYKRWLIFTLLYNSVIFFPESSLPFPINTFSHHYFHLMIPIILWGLIHSSVSLSQWR